MKLIRKPTPQELSTPMLTALPGNNLCPEIEAQWYSENFFVEMSDFVDSTIERTGLENSVENRSEILRAFLKASRTLIFAIVTAQMESSRTPDVVTK